MNPNPSLRELVERRDDVRMRSFLARQGVSGDPERPGDYWAELELSATIAREVTFGRWCAVANLLRLGDVTAWAQVGDALGMTETEASDGFRGWIAGQVNLNRQMGGRIGMTPAEAEALYALAELVTH